jgi:hypothetical protein
MHASGWVTLIQKLPLELQDGLSVVTASGVEIIINQVLRLDEEFLVLRGRLSGSIDNGRIYFVPYDQMNCLIYNRMAKAHEVQQWFNDDQGPTGSGEGLGVIVARDGDEIPMEDPTEAASLPGFAAAGLGSANPEGMSPAKAAMLERLRARAIGKSVQGTARKPGLSVSSQGTVARPGLSVQGATPKPTGQSLQGNSAKPTGQSLQGNTAKPTGQSLQGNAPRPTGQSIQGDTHKPT